MISGDEIDGPQSAFIRYDKRQRVPFALDHELVLFPVLFSIDLRCNLPIRSHFDHPSLFVFAVLNGQVDYIGG